MQKTKNNMLSTKTNLRTKIFGLISTLTVACLMAIPLCQAAELLQISEYHGDEVRAKTGQIWIGLFPTEKEGQYKLAAAKVTVTMVNDAIVDDPGQKTGKKVSVDSKTEPIVLLRGINKLKPGPVKTSRVATDISGMDTLDHATTMQLKTGQLTTKLIVSTSKTKEVLADYSVVLERDGIKQTLFKRDKLETSGCPRLIWAGDLDGDGKLDLLLDTTSHYNLSRPTLFLSTKAKAGKLVEEVVFHESVGC